MASAEVSQHNLGSDHIQYELNTSRDTTETGLPEASSEASVTLRCACAAAVVLKHFKLVLLFSCAGFYLKKST